MSPVNKIDRKTVGSETQYSTTCMGCMLPKETKGKCPYCGWDDANYTPKPYYLPLRTILDKRFLIGRVLDEDPFGINYLAKDITDNQIFSIKEFFPKNLLDRKPNGMIVTQNGSQKSQDLLDFARGKFIEESMVLQNLPQLSGVQRTLDVFRSNNLIYRVQEYVKGTNLKAYINQLQDPLNIDNTIRLLAPIVKSLDWLHDHKMLHYNIHPGNIILDDKRGTTLINFHSANYAIAQYLNELDSVLTPGFSPPELYVSDSHAAQTDIYSLAATAYFCMTGMVAPTATKRLEKDTIVHPTQLNTRFGVDIGDVILDGMAIRITNRPDSAVEFLKQLHDISRKRSPARKDNPKDAFNAIECPVCHQMNELLETDLVAGTAICQFCNTPMMLDESKQISIAPTFSTEPAPEEVEEAVETDDESVNNTSFDDVSQTDFDIPFTIVRCPNCRTDNEVMVIDLQNGAYCYQCMTQLPGKKVQEEQEDEPSFSIPGDVTDEKLDFEQDNIEPLPDTDDEDASIFYGDDYIKYNPLEISKNLDEKINLDEDLSESERQADSAPLIDLNQFGEQPLEEGQHLIPETNNEEEENHFMPEIQDEVDNSFISIVDDQNGAEVEEDLFADNHADADIDPQNEISFDEENMSVEYIEAELTKEFAPPNFDNDPSEASQDISEITAISCPFCRTRTVIPFNEIADGARCDNCGNLLSGEEESAYSRRKAAIDFGKFSRKRFSLGSIPRIWIISILGVLFLATAIMTAIWFYQYQVIDQQYHSFLNQANQALSRGEFEAAIVNYQKALTTKPDEKHLLKQINDIRSNLNRKSVVADSINSLQQFFERETKAADSLYQAQKYEESLWIYEMLKEDLPEDSLINERLKDIKIKLSAAASGRSNSRARTLTTGNPIIDVRSDADLAQYLERAKPNTTLRLAQGLFSLRQEVFLKKSIELIGAGNNKSIIVLQGEGDAISISNNAEFSAQDVGFELKAAIPGNIFNVEDGSINLTNCQLSGAKSNSTLDVGGAVYFGRNSSGTLSGNRFTNNAIGILVSTGKSIEITDNDIVANQQGIVIKGNGQPKILENRIQENRQNGIVITEEGKPIIQKNQIAKNLKNGIDILTDADAGKISDNIIEKNEEIGINVGGTATPYLEKNRIDSNERGGIIYRDKSAGVCKTNTIINNKYGGIRISNQSAPAIQNNTIRENQGDGLEIMNKAKPTVSRNSVIKNGGDGISLVLSQDGGVISDNECIGNRGYGISFLSEFRPKTYLNNTTNQNYEGHVYDDTKAN